MTHDRHAIGKRIGDHYVVCGGFETTSGRFAPIFRIHSSADGLGPVLRRQDFPSPGPDFATVAEAQRAAEQMAVGWLNANASVRP